MLQPVSWHTIQHKKKSDLSKSSASELRTCEHHKVLSETTFVFSLSRLSDQLCSWVQAKHSLVESTPSPSRQIPTPESCPCSLWQKWGRGLSDQTYNVGRNLQDLRHAAGPTPTDTKQHRSGVAREQTRASCCRCSGRPLTTQCQYTAALRPEMSHSHPPCQLAERYAAARLLWHARCPRHNPQLAVAPLWHRGPNINRNSD